MPPIVYSPASGSGFLHTGGPIKWYNGHALHLPKAATQWRLLVGSTSYGENYHSGRPLPVPPPNPLQDLVFNVAQPAVGALCKVVPEYTLASGQIVYGTVTTFTAQ